MVVIHSNMFFMSLGPCIRSFQGHIRKVIVVDGTFMKRMYYSTLSVAICLDGNNQIYPLIFGVGDLENDASWSWFLTRLRDAIDNFDDLTFISDRHKSIEKSIKIIFLSAIHRVYRHHLKMNVLTKYENETIRSVLVGS